MKYDKIKMLSSKEYHNKINELMNNISNEINKNNILKALTSNNYIELINVLSIRELGKEYKSLEEEYKYWINSFMFYDNYYLWLKSMPYDSNKIGNAFRSLYDNLNNRN